MDREELYGEAWREPQEMEKMEDLCVSWLMTDDPLGIKGGR